MSSYTATFGPSLAWSIKMKRTQNILRIAGLFESRGFTKSLRQEDARDLAAFDERTDDPILSYDELLTDLKAHGKL